MRVGAPQACWWLLLGKGGLCTVVACTCNRVWLRCVVVPEGACSTFSFHICVTQAAVLHRRCHRCVIVTALLLGIGSQRVNGLWVVWCGGRTRSGMGAFFWIKSTHFLPASSSFPCSFPPVLVFTHVILDLAAMDAGVTALNVPDYLFMAQDI